MDRCKDDNVSVSSLRSGCPATSLADAAARARARAEAARARAAFSEKEMRLKIERAETEAKLHLEKAKLDAELGALNLQREVAAAIAQAEILEAAVELDGGGPCTSVSKSLWETDDTEHASSSAHSKLHSQTMDTAHKTSPPNKKRKLEKARKPLSFTLPQAGLKELQARASAINGSARNPVDSVTVLVEKNLTDLRVLYKHVPCRKQQQSLFVTAVENTWIHGRQKRREHKRQLRELPRAPHCVASSSQSAAATAVLATNPSSQNQLSPTQNTQDDDAEDKTAEESNGASSNEMGLLGEEKEEDATGDNMDMQSSTCTEDAASEPPSKRPLSPSAVEHFLFKCLLNVMLEESDVVVEMHWVEGQNKDLMNQLCTYLKNALLKSVAKS